MVNGEWSMVNGQWVNGEWSMVVLQTFNFTSF